MARQGFIGFDPQRVPSPCFVVDEVLVKQNLECLSEIRKRTGVKILMALKGCSMFSLFPLIKRYLPGVCASGLHEARLGYEEFGKEVHTYSPAYKEEEFQDILKFSNHVIFNSFSQWERFKPLAKDSFKNVKFGLRVNPELSTVETPIYDPCGKHSRLGVTKDAFKPEGLKGISGLHLHGLCEQGAEDLELLTDAFEDKFGEYLHDMEWVNFGGGHWITKSDYNADLLCRIINRFKKKYDLQVYIEPGEAIVLHTGILVSTVLDSVNNGMDIAILDIAVPNHMPDVLEMPYRPVVWGGRKAGVQAHDYRLGGVSCLAGDVVGDYSFSHPLERGSKVIFDDMTHYTMVKTTTFNGVKLPSIGIYNSDTREFRLVKEFGYSDFKGRI